MNSRFIRTHPVRFWIFIIFSFSSITRTFGLFSITDIKIRNQWDTIAKDSITHLSLDPMLDELKEDSVNLGANFEQLNKARSILGNIIDKSKIVDKIAGGDWLSLPIIQQKTIHNIVYTMAVTDVLLNPGYIQASVYLGIEIPQKGKVLYFGSPDIKFSSSGGIIGDARLGLLADYAINLGANKSILILKGMYRGNDKGCFVRIDCDGFKELSLDAEVLFSRDLVVPVDQSGYPLAKGHVKGKFSLICSDWNDILTNITLPHFAMSDYRDLAFDLNTAVIDLSDVRNDPGVKFPQEYADPEIGGVDVSWRGVYVRSLKVILPSQFKKKNQSGRLDFAATDLLLDHSGVSGYFSAGHVISMNDGAMNKWAYSLDTIGAEFVSNRMKHFGFEGVIRIPIANNTKKQGIDYSAYMSAAGGFVFNASLKDPLQFPVFQAGRVSIEKNSIVTVTIDKHDFYPEALLYGNLSIQASLNGDKLESPDTTALFRVGKLTFQGLHLSTTAPYLEVKHTDLSVGSTLAKFPITIDRFSFDTRGTESRILVGLTVNLVPESETAFGLHTEASIFGSMDASSGVHQWNFDRFNLDALTIKMSIKNFSLNGRVYVFEDNPDYGTGFQGNLKANLTITGNKKFDFEANALFGRTQAFRYWYADGKLALGNGIELGGGLKLTGFGGGAYRHMSMAGTIAKGATGIGINTTGIKYIPDEGIGLGILAAVSMAEANPSLFSATAALDMAFNTTGGLNYVNFYGYGGFLAKTTLNTGLAGSLEKRLDRLASLGLKKSNEADKADAVAIEGSVAASLFMNVDFNNDEFHGNLAIYMDLIHGNIRGASGGDKSFAGAADLLFTPGIWHIYLGTWDKKLAVALNLGALKGYAAAYFMAGNDLGAPPPLDPIIARELKLNADQLNADRNANGAVLKGSGIAFGANAGLTFDYAKTPRKYIHLAIGAGFEVYLIDYGDKVTCSNLSGLSSPIGANGWRAGGRIYAFANISGRWGIIGIPHVGLALLVESELPNPNHFRVAGAFTLIFEIKFNVESGESCNLIQ